MEGKAGAEIRMTLIADLDDFIHDHRSHGPLTGDATEPAWNGYLLTVACLCPRRQQMAATTDS